jgi:hypothetical protein
MACFETVITARRAWLRPPSWRRVAAFSVILASGSERVTSRTAVIGYIRLIINVKRAGPLIAESVLTEVSLSLSSLRLIGIAAKEDRVRCYYICMGDSHELGSH